MAEIYLLKEHNETKIATDNADRSEEKPEKGFHCRLCGHRITTANQAIEVNDAHHHTFFNPAGIVYEIRCFSSADGCHQYGPFSDEFTWFASYSWRLALCGACSLHLGWYFSSGELGFYGLIDKNLSS